MFLFFYITEITFKKVDIVDLRREFVYVFGDLKFQFGRKGTEIKNDFFLYFCRNYSNIWKSTASNVESAENTNDKKNQVVVFVFVLW